MTDSESKTEQTPEKRGFFQLPDGLESAPGDYSAAFDRHVATPDDETIPDAARGADAVLALCKKAIDKVREFPHRPGVYLMKDAADRVIYIGKAKNLRNRAGSYFYKTAVYDPRTENLVREIRDIACIETESEVDAILMEARLVKDVRPKYNRDLKDSKTFPYLQITIREPYPRIEITREPKSRGVKLIGPFPSASSLRGAVQALQKIFRFRTCTLQIRGDDKRWQWFRPCLLGHINQCSAPCNFSIDKQEYRKNVMRLIRFLEGNKKPLLRDMQREMLAASEELRYEHAADLRDQIRLIETIDQRGDLETHVQPEVFQIDPRRGVIGLQRLFKLSEPPRTIEGVDVAHISGKDMVASFVHFIDGLPFKPGYRRYKIRTVQGVDDFAAIAEVVARRFSHANSHDNPPPDILLIDGGKGQLHAAEAALEHAKMRPRMILSLAKKEEEIFIAKESEPIRLSRRSFALRLLQYVRDEAHRFAQHYHHLLRKKSTFE
ncbi:MAG: excinuclease ABC subunit UvrC [Planctomycetaceae bacterium]|jgi:excinuclease ABC subunit C|nr:excinuclease ABC subunit UvrC [Planctomycetaceae bacterium]